MNARTQRITLESLGDIRRHFASATTPTYFVSASNFNLMGMRDWVAGWHDINLLDCFDGQQPHALIVADDHSRILGSIEDINHYLLDSPAARELIGAGRGKRSQPGQVMFLFFDEELATKSARLGLELVRPPCSLVQTIDSKIVTTEIGNQAGVSSVPHVLAAVRSFGCLKAAARTSGLGDRWVVQTAYGDSGKTTFFIDNETQYRAAASVIEAEPRVKIMRRIACTGAAIEACATRWGTVVGPLLTELIGVDTLTPYAGGWCGNELYDGAFPIAIRQQVLDKTRAMGDALYQRGYRGYFELDYLIDQDTQEVFLGELNARVSGITAMTNLSDFSQSTVPLFLFHLLEYDPRVDLALDVQAFNQAVVQAGAAGTAAQLVLKYTESASQIITRAPQSGVYRMGGDGQLRYEHASSSRRDALAPDQAFVLRLMQEGEHSYRGADQAIMFVNEVVRAGDGQLNANGKRWASALQAVFGYRSLTQEERSAVELAHRPAAIKGGRTP